MILIQEFIVVQLSNHLMKILKSNSINYKYVFFVLITFQFLWQSFLFLIRGIYPIILLFQGDIELVVDHRNCKIQLLLDGSKKRVSLKLIGYQRYSKGKLCHYIKIMMRNLPVQVSVFLHRMDFVVYFSSYLMVFLVFLIVIVFLYHYIVQHQHHHLVQEIFRRIRDLKSTDEK